MKYNPLHPHCGPWNTVDKYPPKDKTDRVCWAHDMGYGRLGKKGYWKSSSEDQRYIKKMMKAGFIGKQYAFPFRLKRLVASSFANDYKGPPQEPVAPQSAKRGAAFYLANPKLKKAHSENSFIQNSRKVQSMARSKRYRSKRKRSKSKGKNSLSKRLRLLSKRIAATKWGPLITKKELRAGQSTVPDNKVLYLDYKTALRTDMGALLSQGMRQIHPVDTNGDGTIDGHQELVVPQGYDATYRPYIDGKLKLSKSSGCKMTFRNNDMVSMDIKFYEYLCMDWTNTTPNTLITNAIIDQNNGSILKEDHPAFYPSSVEHQFKSLWKRVKKVKSVRLDPSGEINYYFSAGTRQYDIQLGATTESGQGYVPGVSKFLLVRVTGVLATGVTSGAGTLGCNIDWIEDCSLSGRVKEKMSGGSISYTNSYDLLGAGQQAQEDVELNDGL